MKNEQHSIQHLSQWQVSDIGGLFLAAKKLAFDAVLASLPGVHLLQVGEGSYPGLLAQARAAHKWQLTHHATPHPTVASVLGHFEQLPFSHEAVNLVVLNHALEYCDEPFWCLKEADRILTPEGYLIIAGFKPVSLLRAVGKLPHLNRLFGPKAIRNWANSHDYLPVTSRTFFHQAGILKKTFNPKSVSRFLFPWASAGFILVFKKRQLTLTPVRKLFNKEQSLLKKRLPQATARSHHIEKS